MWNKGYNQPIMTFRDEFSDKFRFDKQMDACMDAFNLNNHQIITFCVNGLLLLLTPNIIDPDFTTQITSIEQQEKDFMSNRKKDYDAKVSKAKLPDLIEVPLPTPPLHINQLKFMTARALLERKDLLLKQKRDGFL